MSCDYDFDDYDFEVEETPKRLDDAVMGVFWVKTKDMVTLARFVDGQWKSVAGDYFEPFKVESTMPVSLNV